MAVLAVALGVSGVATGIVLRGSGSVGTESPRVTLKPATIVASRDLEPSSDAAVVSWGDKVQVTVPGGLLDRPRTLTIGTLDELPPSPPAFSMHGAYDISLGDLHELAQPVQIRLAVDPTQLDPGVPASQQLAFFRFNEERSIWEDVPAAIDDTGLTATLSVTHLSVYGEGRIDLQHFQQLAKQPIYLFDNPAPHFRVIFDPNLNATFVDPTAIQVQGPQPPKKKAGSNDILRYAYWVAVAAEQAWAAYDRAGLDPPGKTNKCLTDIVIENDGGLFEASFSWRTGVIRVPTVYGAWPELKLAMGHELFHALQWANLGAVMFVNRWFIEATAELAAGRIASTPTSDPGRLMGKDINAQYLEFSVQSVLEANADDEGRANNPERQHAYASSHLLDFLLNLYAKGQVKGKDTAGRFLSLWQAYVAAAFTSGRGVSATQVIGTWLGGGLDDAYRVFAAYFLFNTASPLPGAPARLPVPVLAGRLFVLLGSEAAQSSDSVQINVNYAALPWVFRVHMKGTATTRTVKIAADSALPNLVGVDIYVLSGNAPRQNLPVGVGRWPAPKTACTLSGTTTDCTLTVTADDEIYAVAVNAGGLARNVRLTVSDATPASPTPTGRWVLIDAVPNGGPDASSYSKPGEKLTVSSSNGAISVSYDNDGPPHRTTEGSVSWGPPPSSAAPGDTWTTTLSATGSCSGDMSDFWEIGVGVNVTGDTDITKPRSWGARATCADGQGSTPVSFAFPAPLSRNSLEIDVIGGDDNGRDSWAYNYRWQP